MQTGFTPSGKLGGLFALLGGAGSGYLRQPGGEQPPSPTQVVCFVNHRLTVSSLVSSFVSSPVVAGHAHTLAHSDTAPSRQAHTHSHLVPLKVTGEQPAQPLGLYSGHSGRSRASRTLSAGLVLASLQSSPPLSPRQCLSVCLLEEYSPSMVHAAPVHFPSVPATTWAGCSFILIQSTPKPQVSYRSKAQVYVSSRKVRLHKPPSTWITNGMAAEARDCAGQGPRPPRALPCR